MQEDTTKDIDEFENNAEDFISTDDVAISELEYALYEDSLRFESTQIDEETVPSRVGSMSRATVRNLFSKASYEAAKKNEQDPLPIIREVAARFLAKREAAVGRYCMNPSGCRELPPQKAGRGRKRLYCERTTGHNCKEAAKKRNQRNAENPNRPERLPSFESVPDPRGGFAGYGRYRRKSLPYAGMESMVTEELRKQLHHAAVHDVQPRLKGMVLDYLDEASGWSAIEARARSGRIP